MGWVESPAFFSMASKTARDVADKYAEVPIGALPKHPHLEKTQTLQEEAENMIKKEQALKYLTEVYMDGYITAAHANSPDELDHLANAIMHTINDVFPVPGGNLHSRRQTKIHQKAGQR